uniref:F-box domain-containing protein n=1 Tax=Aegilops tauschii subsp. strangulata TaxID=200361 RepID=A0A453R878_AEGTS
RIYSRQPLFQKPQIHKPSPSPAPPSAMAEHLQAPFNNVDTAMAADPHERERCAKLMLAYIYHNLPDYPLYNGARLTALAAARGADRISRLPPEILRDIVARLPVKDAARTAVLSSRWRALWRSTPLVLVDIHLLPKAQAFRPTPANSPAVTAAVSRILEAHPGPFSCVHLICSQMDGYRAQLARWLQLLAAKGVQDLLLVNHPWPLGVPLPATLFTITTLTRLYVGVWKLPGTAALRGASFPRLRELGLYFVEMEHGVVDSLVARSPVLETLNIVGCMKGGLRLRLVQPEPAVRANLRLCSGGHRRGEDSMPRAVHPVIALQTRWWLVHQTQDCRCPQAARVWIFRARTDPRGPRHCHHARNKGERKCLAHKREDS